MKKIIIVLLVGALAALGTACSKTEDTATKPAANTTAPGNTNAAQAGKSDHPGNEDIPAEVRAVFPDAQQITKQHKDMTPSQIASIEKEAGSKVPDTDHHSYLAFSTAGGTRKQIGAATQVKAGGKNLVIIYESREGKPYIKEIRAAGVAQAFLDQFKGKGHDDKFQIGGDLKAQGMDDATAKAIAQAVHIDILTMQTLYGAADQH